MIVKEIEIQNYRVFEAAHFSFKEGVNIIVGRSGTGKTTILEAIGFAIYGEPLRGSNLVDILRYGSDLCRVSLSLRNSQIVDVVREVRKSNGTASQKITLNGEDIKYSDINRTKRVFPDREIFYEVAWVDPFRHNLLDVNREIIRDTFSKYASNWDIQRVMDGSKSLRFSLRSREKLHSENVMETETLLSKTTLLVKDLENHTSMRDKLQRDMELSQKKAEEIEKEKLEKRVDYQRISNLLTNLDENRRYLEKVVKKLPEKIRPNENMYSQLSNYQLSFAKYFNEYSEKVNTTYRDVLSLKEILDGFVSLVEDISNQVRKIEAKLSEELDHERERMRDIAVRLDNASRKIIEYEKQKATLNQTLEILNRDRKSLERDRIICSIQEKMEELIRISWTRQSARLFSRVKDRINDYFSRIGIDMRVMIEEGVMAVSIEGEKLDLNSLSAGERTLLDLLLRIAVLKELDNCEILILDTPIILLDQQNALKVFSFLESIKKDFRQIIMTTQREDFPVTVDNSILLDAKTVQLD